MEYVNSLDLFADNGITCEPVGAIIATCRLVDIVEYENPQAFLADQHKHLSPGYARYGWVLEDAAPLILSVYYRGQLGLFDVPDYHCEWRMIMNAKNDSPAGATRYSKEATELLQLLKRGKKPVIASGCAGDNPNGFVVRIFGDEERDEFPQDFPLASLFELASHAPLFSGTDAGPLGHKKGKF